MRYQNTAIASYENNHASSHLNLTAVPDMSRVCELKTEHQQEVIAFLAVRPVHTVVMTSFINDNGMENVLNRGKFYGHRNSRNQLDGVALIGHTTLVEARSEDALKALAFAARTSETPIHLIMSEGTAAETFWQHLTGGLDQARLKCTESLFELSFPLPVRVSGHNVRAAKADELMPIAEAQAAIAFMECGVDPMLKDREGFLNRVARRIEQGRVFVVFEGEKLLFKADIIAETPTVAYLEGIYVAPEHRGHGVGSNCLAQLSLELLKRFDNLCLLSNVDFKHAHKSYVKAGYRNTGQCTTLFVYL